jgi:hypothetical protein
MAFKIWTLKFDWQASRGLPNRMFRPEGDIEIRKSEVGGVW